MGNVTSNAFSLVDQAGGTSIAAWLFWIGQSVVVPRYAAPCLTMLKQLFTLQKCQAAKKIVKGHWTEATSGDCAVSTMPITKANHLWIR